MAETVQAGVATAKKPRHERLSRALTRIAREAAGERITLYVGALDDVPVRGSSETAFRFTGDGQVATFYWVDQGFGYALAGKLPRQRLLVLAE